MLDGCCGGGSGSIGDFVDLNMRFIVLVRWKSVIRSFLPSNTC